MVYFSGWMSDAVYERTFISCRLTFRPEAGLWGVINGKEFLVGRCLPGLMILGLNMQFSLFPYSRRTGPEPFGGKSGHMKKNSNNHPTIYSEKKIFSSRY
jgi:hypothetical protein